MKDFFILKGGGVELTGAPETITVLPLGHVVSSKGEFDVDEGSFQAMKAQIAQRGVDLVVDYEHQTLKGVEAPAAGWVKELKLEDGNIVAVVEWTPLGAEYLKNKEYRYLSPVVNVRKMDNKAIGLHSLALTNTPAIENMTPIVNSDNFEGGHENMDMQKLAAAPGLGPDATEEQIVGRGPGLRSGRPQGLRRVCGEGPPGRSHGRDRPGRHRGPQIRQAGRGDHVGLQAAGRQPGRPGEIREGGVSHYGSFD